MTKPRARQERPEVPAVFAPWLASYELHLKISKSKLTVTRYRDVAAWFAGWLGQEHPAVRDWGKVSRPQIQGFLVHLRDVYSEKYAHEIAAALRQFWAWWAAEEGVANPMAGLALPPAPKLGAKPPTVITDDQLAQLIKDAEKGRDYESRRDAAILRLFAEGGARLSEIANMPIGDINLAAREAKVLGKGGKVRTIKFGNKAALALDRYLRLRARRPAVVEDGVKELWIGVRRRSAMTSSGIRQMMVRRAAAAGFELHPHLLRHRFAHAYLAGGGAEGDLVELMGWESTQMLQLYGRSARGERARRAYDQVNVMNGI